VLRFLKLIHNLQYLTNQWVDVKPLWKREVTRILARERACVSDIRCLGEWNLAQHSGDS